MPRLSKFDLMRNNREVAACRINYDRAVTWGEIAGASPIVGYAAPAVPAMTVEGVKYREAPETNVCEGCDLRNQGGECALPGGWDDDNQLTARAFGGGCMNRRVIYIRTEG